VGCAFPLAMSAHASAAGETLYLAVTEQVANGPATGKLVALDAGTGALRYTASDAAANGRVVTTVAVSPDGQTVFVGGHDGGHGELRVFSAMAFRASSGELLWSVHDPKTAEFDAHVGAWGLALSPDGSQLFLTGGDLRNGVNNVAGVTKAGSSGEEGLVTQAYDAATGAPRWRMRYAPLAPLLGDSTVHSSMGQNIAVTPDGSRVIVTATREEVLRSHGWAVVAYDAQTGQQVWDESSSEHPFVVRVIGFSPLIAVSPQGDAVYVTGLMGNANTTPYVTAAYDVQTGAQRWVARWSPQPGGPGLATSIAVAPDGDRLYVAGAARSLEQPDVPGDSWDIVTVAYDTVDAGPKPLLAVSSGNGHWHWRHSRAGRGGGRRLEANKGHVDAE
jgi:outer membrane protein assembly factor BamB